MKKIRNRVTQLLGVEIPIVQAPMGWIARAQLASAVSNAGGMGIIETSSGELDAVRDEIRKMRDLTDKPFGVNVAQLFVRDPKIVDFVVAQGVRFVTTSAGDPTKYTAQLKAAGLTVFHVVPSLKTALGAIAAGVDGLVVEGGEGGGFKNPRDVATMVLLPLVCSHVDVPVIAAGGICDGPSMAAAFALGAEGVLMGTRFMSAAESPAHQSWKQAIADTDITLNIAQAHPEVTMRVVRTELAEAVQRGDVPLDGNPYAGPFMEAFENGRIDLAMVGAGESATLVEAIKPVADIIEETVTGFWREIQRLAGLLHPGAVT